MLGQSGSGRRGPLRTGDSLRGGRDRPGQGPPPAHLGHRQFRDIVSGYLQGALAPNPWLGVLGERCEAVHLLKDGQKETSGLQRIEAAEVLIVLVETANHQLDGVAEYRSLRCWFEE